MADKIRVGIVGATVTQGGSGWGANAHVPALKALPDFELKAVCTAHADTAEASRAAFGAELAFHDIEAMVAHPDIDLIAVSVKVPLHHQLVMAAIRGGKPVLCEWPLGANLAEAEEMASAARAKGVRTAVGLQARSDPALMYAKELIAEGYIGEVLSANLSLVGQAITERGPGRSWQALRSNGANTFTIQGGHGIDALCSVLGEFTEVSARVSTLITEWRDTETGAVIPVDAPDNIAFIGKLANGAEVSVHVAAVPSNPSGSRFEIFGRNGALVVTPRGSMNIGPSQVYAAQGTGALAEMPIPDRFNLVPEGTPNGSPRNVAQAYVRFADSAKSGESAPPDFDLAVVRHRLLDAIERSSETGQVVKL